MFGVTERKSRSRGHGVSLSTWGTHNAAQSLLDMSSITVNGNNQSTFCQRVGSDLPASNSSEDFSTRGFCAGGPFPFDILES